VHRNGRTARAKRRGFGMLMCAPDERRVIRGVVGSLGRGAYSFFVTVLFFPSFGLGFDRSFAHSFICAYSYGGCSCGAEESSIPEMTIEHHLLDKLKPRLQLARQIENAQHKAKKEKHEKNWLKATAEAGKDRGDRNPPNAPIQILQPLPLLQLRMQRPHRQPKQLEQRKHPPYPVHAG
jgi:ATP-dependent RNA helicase DDX24/MAK5